MFDIPKLVCKDSVFNAIAKKNDKLSYAVYFNLLLWYWQN